jgi:D-sedoheptulose 7-phosphate isomerase
MQSRYVPFFDDVAGKARAISPSVLDAVVRMFDDTRARRRKVILVGNGGSAAIASHVAVDLTKAAGVRAVNFNEADLLTCFANDYGYEQWVEKAIEAYADEGDTAVLISSSGKSPNILNGAAAASGRGLQVATLSGFDAKNPLRGLGDVNLWVDSNSYNVVEMVHQIWLLAVVEQLITQATAP